MSVTLIGRMKQEMADTFAIEYVDNATGKTTRGIYRYVLEWVAEQDARKLQAKADAVGRPVTIRAVKTADKRKVN